MPEDLLMNTREEALEVEPVPLGFRIWRMAIHVALAIIFFVLISCLAIVVDHGVHWYASLPAVARNGLNPIIRWEVELIAYTIATVGTLLFLRMLIQPAMGFAGRVIKRP